MTDLMGVDGGSPFPAVDPIPLPAPVWLFKLLLNLTTALHFGAVHLLLGGLLVGIVLNIWGQRTRRADLIETSGGLAVWLPVIMTYVINLGVPPLLFTQVLYGRALYTSSVLIGPYWIAVIPLLIICYQILYTMKGRASAGRPWWGLGLIAFLIAGGIAKIYTANMTLMLRPDLWPELYHAHQSGIHLPSGELAWKARWVFMIASGLTASGILLAWLSTSSVFDAGARQLQAQMGPRIGVAGGVASVLAGFWVWFSQPEAVRSMFANGYGIAVTILWLIAAAGVIAANAFLLVKKPDFRWPLLAGLSGVVFLEILMTVIWRDGLRDAALRVAGFEVWDRAIAVNWSVLLLFLALFVVGLGFVGWLASVAFRSSLSTGETAA